MSEAALWKNLRKKMVPRYFSEVTRHEDSVSSGIADVSFVIRDQVELDSKGSHGWMELKYKSKKPVRRTTICRLDHFTDEQKIWLMKKGRTGGKTFVLLQLERDYLLFDWKVLDYVGTVTTEELYEHACWTSKGKLDAITLWSAINWH